MLIQPWKDFMQALHIKQRHKDIFQHLPNNSLILTESRPNIVRNNDVNYAFRQYSNTIYLTNCYEPNTFWAISNSSFDMACEPANPIKSTWIGSWTCPLQAKSVYGVDCALPINEWHNHLIKLLAKTDVVWLSDAPKSESILIKIKETHPNLNFTIKNIKQLINKLRLKKDEHEISLIKKACSISAYAHIHTMQNCQEVWHEDHIEAAFFSSGRSSGAKDLAYPTIAASGNNACTLHYTNNNKPLSGLVLLDAGMEYLGYAADITRTFPANGKFSSQETDLYSLVLQAQESAIKMLKPGIKWQVLEENVQKILLQGCLDLDIFIPNKIPNPELLKMVFPHSLGHHLGLDVHDPCENRYLEPLDSGNIITIEPGLYLNKNNPYIKSQWQGIGIRIEDDILITQDNYTILSKQAPKSIQAIEDLMS